MRNCLWIFLLCSALAGAPACGDSSGPEAQGLAAAAGANGNGAGAVTSATLAAGGGGSRAGGVTSGTAVAAGISSVTLLAARGGASTGVLVADNSRCFVCHINFQDEKLAVSHAAKNISCELCHGPSDDHCNDENNVTAPEKFYAREDVNALCYACHAPQNMNQVIHKNIIAGTFERKYCTECHGNHHMEKRSRHWDKKTREVIMAKD